MGKSSKSLKSLFWDYDLRAVEKNLQSSFVISRVLEMGTPEQFKILKKKIGIKSIMDFINSKKSKMLSKKSLNFWKIYLCKKG